MIARISNGTPPGSDGIAAAPPRPTGLGFAGSLASLLLGQRPLRGSPFVAARAWRAWRRWLLAIPPEETTFERRGFRGGSVAARTRLETIGRAFVAGYDLALGERDLEDLAVALERIEGELRGFAYEGAAMGLGLLDALTPWRRCGRVQEFLRGAGEAHAYMVHVGLGWVWGRLPIRVGAARARLDPLLGWLALDGLGFHEGFFRWSRYEGGQPHPRRLTGYERRAFDQGLGRCLWFNQGADVERVAAAVGAFPTARRGDLWSGVGLAAAYAGIVEPGDLRRLLQFAKGYEAEAAQGVAFAAKARLRAGNLAPHTGTACEVVCGLSSEGAAAVTDEALVGLGSDGAVPAFEIWRCRVQERFARRVVVAGG